MTLHVRKFGDGVWVDNGKRAVWINSKLLDDYTTLYAVDGFGQGSLIYTIEGRLKIGSKYTAYEASRRGQEKDIVVDKQGHSYQKLDSYWHSSKSDVNHVSLPDGVYTVVWIEP